jgi:hypothetical protein
MTPGERYRLQVQFKAWAGRPPEYAAFDAKAVRRVIGDFLAIEFLRLNSGAPDPAALEGIRVAVKAIMVALKFEAEK